MKKQTTLLFIFWALAFIVVAWLFPFMARENNFLNDFLSYCVTFIKWQGFYKRVKGINKLTLE